MEINKTIQNISQSIAKDDCQGMAAEMAYNLVLSLFPFLISATAIFGILGNEDTINRILGYIQTFAPSGVLKIIEDTLKEIIHPSSGGLFTVSFLAGLFFASNAAHVLMKVLNRAYGVPETRPFWKRRIIAILAVIIFILAMLFVTNVVIMGNLIIAFLNNQFHFNEWIISVIILAKWPIAFFLLCLIGFIIYYFMPNITTGPKSRLLSSLPGTVFFTVTWLLVSRLFGLYVEHFGRYNKVYGTLGVFVILLLWMYYTSLVILVGGEINSEFYKQIKTRNN
jgi:membrane protein